VVQHYFFPKERASALREQKECRLDNPHRSNPTLTASLLPLPHARHPRPPPPPHLPIKIPRRTSRSAAVTKLAWGVPPGARSHGSSAERQRRERSFLFAFFFFLLIGVVVRVGNVLVSLTCSWKCCSQGGYANRPHPHVVRGAAAAAPQVLGIYLLGRVWTRLCVPSCYFFSGHCILTCWCWFQELWHCIITSRWEVGLCRFCIRW
jgi:hypothetical protein